MDRSKIKTVIFCGGQGTRLREETEYKPKPMVRIGEYPLVYHIIKGYHYCGYSKFVLCLGYKGWVIKDYFANFKAHATDFTVNLASNTMTFHDSLCDDVDITCVDTGVGSLTGKRLAAIEKYIDTDIFLATYGDGVSDIDINKLVDFHVSHGKMATITGVHPRSKYGLVETDPNDVIKQFSQYPVLYDYTNGGFIVFNREIFNEIQGNEMIETTFARLVEKEQLALYRYDGFWYAMDTYKDMEVLQEMYKKGETPWMTWE